MRSLRALSGFVFILSSISKDGDCTANFSPCLTVFRDGKIFLVSKLDFSFYNLDLLFLIFLPCATVKSLALSFAKGPG